MAYTDASEDGQNVVTCAGEYSEHFDSSACGIPDDGLGNGGNGRVVLSLVNFPTFLPSNSPSTTPTLLSTTEPTFVPSIIPSIAPSNAPTRIPSFTPTVLPTTDPSTIPTRVRSAVPTLQVLSKSQVLVTQEIQNADPSSLSSVAGATTFKQAVVNSVTPVEITTDDVIINSFSSTTSTYNEEALQFEILTNKMTVEYTIKVQANVAYLIPTRLQASVMDGTFTAKLQAAAIANSVTELQSATSTTVPIIAIILVNPTTAPVTPSTIYTNSDSSLSLASIIVSSCVVFLFLSVLCAAYLLYIRGKLSINIITKTVRLDAN